jgi:phospholipase/carboxylesterase
MALTSFDPLVARGRMLLRRRWRWAAALAAAVAVVLLGRAAFVAWNERAVVPVTEAHRAGRLSARPHPPRRPSPGVGLVRLGLARSRDAVLYVPASLPRSGPVGLVLWLHGYSQQPERGIRRAIIEAERTGLLLLAPGSRRVTWDALRGLFGPDVAVVDAALSFVYDRFPVDPRRVSVAGYSDGGSYALSLGLLNGDLFAHVVAFAPERLVPVTLAAPIGRPAVFVAHGRTDEVHPIDQTAVPLVRRLKEAGYAVAYHAFDAGHSLPQEALTRGFDALRVGGAGD